MNRDEQWADVELVTAAVLAEVDYAIWTATGGSDGCAQCSNRSTGVRLTFAERVAKGHLDCAEEGAVDKGARSVKYGLTTGGLNARLFEALSDPRLGAGW